MNLEGLQKHAVTRSFVVKGKRSSLVSDLHDATGMGGPAIWLVARRNGFGRRGTIRRPERIAGEHVFDVGEQQLLMLLLVVDSQLDDPGDFRCVVIVESAQ